jgi:hypothetical protein
MQKQVLFKSFPVQDKFIAAVFSNKYRMCCIAGGAGSGKTFCSLSILLMLLDQYPGSRAVVIRQTLMTMKNTIMDSLEKLVPKKFIANYNASETKYTFVNGSSLLFFSEDFESDKLQNRFKGLEVNFCLLEEASELQEQTLDVCFLRTGRHILPGGFSVKQPPVVIMLCSNAEPGWVKDKFYTPWKEGTLASDIFFLQCNMFDNPYHTKEYIENYKKSSTYFNWQKFGLGNWDIVPAPANAIYRSFNVEKHVGKCKYNSALPLWVSWDENVNPYTPTAIFQIVKEADKTHVYLIKELLGRPPYNTIQGVCDMIKREYHAHDAGMYICGDATSVKSDTKIQSGANMFTLIMGYLKQYSPVPRWMKSNANVVMRINFWNQILEKNFANIHFMINEECTASINDFVSTREDVDGSKLKELAFDAVTKTRCQKNGHLSDAADYFLTSAFAIQFDDFKRGGRKEVPIKWGKNPPSRNSYDIPKNTMPPRFTKPPSKNSYK